jgi:hypothetical protein
MFRANILDLNEIALYATHHNGLHIFVSTAYVRFGVSFMCGRGSLWAVQANMTHV